MMTRRFNLNFICLTVGIAVITGILTPTAKAVNRSKQTNRILKSASEFDYPPFSLVRPDGSADGFSVDLLKSLRINLKLLREKLQNCKFDILNLTNVL